jgi:hypothetical protein
LQQLLLTRRGQTFRGDFVRHKQELWEESVHSFHSFVIGEHARSALALTPSGQTLP